MVYLDSFRFAPLAVGGSAAAGSVSGVGLRRATVCTPVVESASGAVSASRWPFPGVPPGSLLTCGGAADATSGTCCSVVCGTAVLVVAALGTNVTEGARPANKGSPVRGSASSAALATLLPHRDLRFFLSSSPVPEVVAAESSGRFVWGWSGACGFGAAGFLTARGANMMPHTVVAQSLCEPGGSQREPKRARQSKLARGFGSSHDTDHSGCTPI